MADRADNLNEVLIRYRKAAGHTNCHHGKKQMTDMWRYGEARRQSVLMGVMYNPIRYAEHIVDPFTGRVPPQLFVAISHSCAQSRASIRGDGDPLEKIRDFALAWGKSCFRLPAAWTPETPAYTELLTFVPRTPVEMEAFLWAVLDAKVTVAAAQNGVVVPNAELVAAQRKLAVPPRFADAERWMFRRLGEAQLREEKVERILMGSTGRIKWGNLAVARWPICRVTPAVWTQASQNQLLQDGLQDARLVVGAQVPSLDDRLWNDVLAMEMRLPGGPAVYDYVTGLFGPQGAHPVLPSERLACLADLQLTQLAARRFDHAPSDMTAMEFAAATGPYGGKVRFYGRRVGGHGQRSCTHVPTYPKRVGRDLRGPIEPH